MEKKCQFLTTYLTVSMHTQNNSHAEYDGTIHLATLNAYQVDKYLYIFQKSRKVLMPVNELKI